MGAGGQEEDFKWWRDMIREMKVVREGWRKVEGWLNRIWARKGKGGRRQRDDLW